MAVIVKYIVVRNGVEKMTFMSKKEADAYDKMLDVADNMFEFIETSGVEIDEKSLEDISMYLAENKEKVISILKGSKPKAAKSEKQKSDGKAEKEKTDDTESTANPEKNN